MPVVDADERATKSSEETSSGTVEDEAALLWVFPEHHEGVLKRSDVECLLNLNIGEELKESLRLLLENWEQDDEYPSLQTSLI